MYVENLCMYYQKCAMYVVHMCELCILYVCIVQCAFCICACMNAIR